MEKGYFFGTVICPMASVGNLGSGYSSSNRVALAVPKYIYSVSPELLNFPDPMKTRSSFPDYMDTKQFIQGLLTAPGQGQEEAEEAER
jgi:hypothetical protein